MNRPIIVLLTAISIAIPGIGRDVPVYYLLQNAVTAVDLAGVGIRKGVSISGSSLCWKKGDSVETALSYTAAAIEAQFSAAVSNLGIVDDPGTYILLDLEHPVHPRDFHRLGVSFPAVVKAFSLRTKTARKLLPRSTIALYGIVNPQPQGEYTEEFVTQFTALRKAGTLGMYDDVDHIVPVLYTRFGSNDSDRQRSGQEQYIRMGLEASALMVRSDGRPVPLAPILCPRVLNGSSRNEYDTVPVSDMRRILTIISEYASVHAVLFWEGWDGYPLKPGAPSMEIGGFGGTRTIYPLDVKGYFASVSPKNIMNAGRYLDHTIPQPLQHIGKE